ncbi:zinc finger protein, partial [Clarias magur]
MTKLDELNAFLSERLSAAVNEILDTMSRMMQEYEEETARVRKENDYLKEMLKLTGWSFTEIHAGVSFGNQDDTSNLQHEAENHDSWCQNPELKEEGPRIKIEQPDPLYPAHPDSEPPDKYPIPDLETGSPISDVWSIKTRKGKSRLKLKKKNYCLYCRKPSLRMKQHLLSTHAKEPEVAKALSYDNKSKERKQLLDLLQSKGNLLHKDVGMSGTSVSSKCHTIAGSNTDYVQCIYCLGLYSSKSIANHVKKCQHKYPCSHESGPVSGTIPSRTGTPLSQELLTADQVSSPNSDRSCGAKPKNPSPESVSTDVSDTCHIAAQLYTNTESTGSSPCEDSGWAGEHLLPDLESESDPSLYANLLRNDHMHRITPCSTPLYNQTETSSSEDKKTDAEQSKENGYTVENRKRSSHIETQSRVMDNPLDEEEGVAHNTQLHICQHCSATFRSPYHLRRHEYTHTGERPFWCSECNIGFIQKYRYRNHRMTYHEDQQFIVYKDQARRRKKSSSSGKNPAECELQQQVAESSTGTSEPFYHFEESEHKE